MIEIRGLAKSYQGFTAVKGISFDVTKGAVFGFIGPNGAGKTTTIRILATLLEPSAGSVKIDGLDVVDEPEKVRRIIGYMPDDFGVYEGITVQEYLDFFAAAYGLSRRQRARTVADVMALTDLAQHEKKLVASLSKGMRQRLCLAKTLVHDPKLLILDEPANGLDPRARIELRVLLKELAAMGKTIVISSHILTELSDVCTEVGIIERGELLAAGPIAEVEANVRATAQATEAATEGEEKEEGLRCSMKFATVDATEKALAILAARPDVKGVSRRDERAIGFVFQGRSEELHRVVAAVVKEEVALTGLTEEEKDLEAIFMAVTKGKLQ
ncbi:MAG TPA: ABC transporter ATP-binding protein [Planctomycetota bacterium]|nr:ABC transporter ATP-binding protein [Planctomycetota bacterium]